MPGLGTMYGMPGLGRMYGMPGMGTMHGNCARGDAIRHIGRCLETLVVEGRDEDVISFTFTVADGTKPMDARPSTPLAGRFRGKKGRKAASKLAAPPQAPLAPTVDSAEKYEDEEDIV